MNIWLSNIIRFVLCISLQVLLFNNLNIYGICTPYIYILFLVSLPIELPRWAELLIGAATGLVMDVFCSSIGVHMSACVLLSYLRPLLINLFVQDKERLSGDVDIDKIGLQPYINILAILTVAHHIMMFTVESGSASMWWLTLIRIVASSILSFVIMIGYELLRRR